jgi:hypothetical protein
MVYAYFEDGQMVQVEATSDTEVDVPLPVLDSGKTISTLYISIDKNYFIGISIPDPINVEA